MTKRWTVRPEGANWGDFGENDEAGRLNLITPARRRAGIAEAREGIAFILSLPLDLPRPEAAATFRRPPVLAETLGHNAPFEHLFHSPGAIDIGNDDLVTLHLQYSTQWDAVCHVGAFFDVSGTGKPEAVYYNGFKAHLDIVGASEGRSPVARRLGIERQAETGVQGRGVLVDLYKIYGEDWVKIGRAELEAAMRAQSVVVEPGDILCLRTGYADAIVDGGAHVDRDWLGSRFACLDGDDQGLLDWITESGVAAIAADNFGVEAEPQAGDRQGLPMLPLHHHCLFKLGLPLGELWSFRELADWLGAAGRNRFLLTAPPLRLPGAVGSPVTPVATV